MLTLVSPSFIFSLCIFSSSRKMGIKPLGWQVPKDVLCICGEIAYKSVSWMLRTCTSHQGHPLGSKHVHRSPRRPVASCPCRSTTLSAEQLTAPECLDSWSDTSNFPSGEAAWIYYLVTDCLYLHLYRDMMLFQKSPVCMPLRSSLFIKDREKPVWFLIVSRGKRSEKIKWNRNVA